MTVQDRKPVKKERRQKKTVQDKKEKNIVRKTTEKMTNEVKERSRKKQ